MSTFDERNVRRVQAGVAAGGQFAAARKAETDVSLPGAGPGIRPAHHAWQIGEWADGMLAPQTGTPRPDGAVDLGDEDAVQAVVHGVLASALREGRSDHAARPTTNAWRYWARRKAEGHPPGSAQAHRYAQFDAGLQHGVLALLSSAAESSKEYVVTRVQRDLGSAPTGVVATPVLAAMTSKRTSKASRQEWARVVLETPDDPMRRGMIVAGAVMAGQDGWWGLRGNPELALG